MPPASWSALLELGVALPLAATLVGAFDPITPPAAVAIIRVDRWRAAIAASGLTLWVPAALLLGGTALMVVAQELVPRVIGLRHRPPASQDGTPRLYASLERVKQAFARQQSAVGSRGGRARVTRARVRSLDSERRQAGLSGWREPTVTVSRGLADALDDQALDAVVAHELAHLVVGGRARLVWLWLARLVQAANPATLVLFRSLIESRESACDAMAAQVTGKPLALAAALLEAHRLAPVVEGEGQLARAQRRVLRRAEVASVRARVAQLRGEHAAAPPTELSWATRALAVALLGGLLWLVG